ncbi:MAG: radical SAM protein [Candidatus Hermodarchaeota archaeon]|nr:radical SAM protein [Candidatus Hermodarchaeota archaeon]
MEKMPPKELPYTTKSICPECFCVIEATVYEEGGKVMMKKECKEHGEYKDTYWSSASEFNRAFKFAYKGIGLENPRTETVNQCPNDCGLCPNHKTHTNLALIDVTNRCNLECPICFAHAGKAGYVVEPSLEEIRSMLENLRANEPVPTPAVQFAGGEPTMRADLPEIIKMAKDVGFPHVEIATNGLLLAQKGYPKKLVEAGLSTVYMQFDGVTKEPYLAARGVNLLSQKLKALERCREEGLHSIVLVPTLVRGINDEQIGDIIRFAVENSDIVRCINFQPVAITGRIDAEKRAEMRITIPDLTRLAEAQTDGLIKQSDWYPVPFVMPLSRALGARAGSPMVEFSEHPACGMATFIVIEDDGSWSPITNYVEVEKFLGTLEKMARDYERGKRWRGTMRGVMGAMRFFKKKGLLFRLANDLLRKKDYDSLAEFMKRIIMVGSMHFMDPYNFDLERVERCGIHYAIPDGRIVPFCANNSLHREKIEKQFAISVEEWQAEHPGKKMNAQA